MSLRKERVAKKFSQQAEIYLEKAVTQQKIVQDLLAYAQPYLNKNDKMLDLGCGPGTIGSLLKDYNLVQLDIASGMCAIAQKNNHQTICADIEKMPFEDASFKAAISSMSLQWVKSKNKALSEMSRVLDEGSKVMLALLLDDSFQAVKKIPQLQHSFFSYINLDEFIETSKTCGFEFLCAYEKIYKEEYANILAACRQVKSIGASEKENEQVRANLFALRDSAPIALDYHIAYVFMEKI